MKWVLRIGAVLGVLLVLGVVALAIALPRLAASDAVRGRIEAAARDALGRELRYRELDFGLLPPSLVVVEPAIAGARPEEPPFARADRVALRVALLPLLARRVVVDSLVVDGAAVHLVRTAEGLELPRPAPRAARKPPAGTAPPAPDETAPPAPDETGARGADGRLAIAVRSVALRDSGVVLDDRAVSPAVTWRIEGLDLEVTGSSPEAPLDVSGSLRLATGGALQVSGTATLDGELALDLALRDVDLAAAEPYVAAAAPGARLAGRLGGDVHVTGPAADPEVAAQLEVADARVAAAGADVSGPLDIDADIAGAASRPTGPFRLDATRARIVRGDGFAKPAGTTATLDGRLVADAGGAPGVDDLVLALKDAVVRGRLRTAPALRAELSADAFPLDGVEELVPALGRARLGGAVAIPGLAVTAKPLGLEGSVELRDVVANLPDLAPVTLNGVIDAQGTALRSRDLVLVAAKQRFPVQVAVRDLAATPRFEIDLSGERADTNALLSAYTGNPDRVYGPLDVKGTLRGSVGDRPLLDAVSGVLDFEIDDGRIVGVSLLEAVFDRLGSLGGLALEAGRVFGGRDLQRFYGDEFEKMLGRLRVADGRVVADELSLLYRGYAADLTGTVGLADLSLDLHGTLTIAEDLDAEIARGLGAARGYTPRRRRLPLASLGGTLGAPRVQLTRSAAVDFVAGYATDAARSRLGREAEKELGPGTGEAVEKGLEVLEGILGGKKKP